jgi:hypothetical protein
MKKNKLWVVGMAAVVLAFGLVMAGCDSSLGAGTGTGGTDTGGGNVPAGIPLTFDTWADGAVSSSNNNEQWFKFTATASTQYIHVLFGTMTKLDVGLYDSKGNALGDSIQFYGNSNTNKFVSRTMTSGQVYYLRVISGTYYSSNYSNSGTFRIAFNSMQWPPDTITKAATLSANTWADGVITSSTDEQWFKFTATAGSQYIHVQYGSMTTLYVGLYDSNGTALGNSINFHGSSNTNANNSIMVTSGQMYYLRVTPGTAYSYGSSKSGTYRIGFNTSTTAPN